MKHFRQSLLLSRSAVTAGLGITFVLLVATTALTAFSTHGVASADRRAMEADRILTAATRVLVTLGEMESVALTYRTSAHSVSLSAYETARTRFTRDFAALSQQLEKRGQITPLFLELQDRLRAKARDLEQAMRTAATTSAIGLDDQAIAESARQTAELRELAHAVQRQELATVADESAVAVARAQTIQTLNLVLVALAMGLAIVGAWLLLRRMRELDGLITICAWTHRVRWEGRWVTFEDFLAKRFHVLCTHGICDEAAAKIRSEMDNEMPADVARH